MKETSAVFREPPDFKNFLLQLTEVCTRSSAKRKPSKSSLSGCYITQLLFIRQQVMLVPIC